MKSNIIYLTFIQLLRFVVPVLTFPYLTRVLGIEGFGYLSFATAVIAYSMIFCQYGFDLTATAKISKIKKNRKKLDVYVSGVLLSKLILFLVSILVSMLFLFFNDDKKLMLLVLALLPMAIGTMLTPTWLFQGLEKMKELTFITLISRILIIPLVFVFINNEGDIYLATFLQGAPFFISCVLSWVYIYQNKTISIKKIRFSYAIDLIRSGWDVFVTTLSSSVYLSLFPIIIGYIHGPVSVGYFNVANTIKNICISCFAPIYQTIFPRVNSLIIKDSMAAKKILSFYFIVSVSLALLGGGGVILFSGEVIDLVSGLEYIEAKHAVQLMMVVVVVSVVNNFFGVQSLIPTGNELDLKKVVAKAAILCLILSLPTVALFDYSGAVLLMLLTEVYIFVSLIKIHHNKSIELIIKIKA